jgi:hypothetical protein
VLFEHEYPSVGEVGYLGFGDEQLIPFTFTQDMVSTKNTAWLMSMEGFEIIGLSESDCSVGDITYIAEAQNGILVGALPLSYGGAITKISTPEDYCGTIYYMKDEWGNECPYDFKNLKFGRRGLSNSDSSVPDDLVYNNGQNKYNFLYGSEPGEPFSDYFYTFSLKDLASGTWYDASVVASIGLSDGVQSRIRCANNKISAACFGQAGNMFTLPDIVFFNVFEDITNVTSVTEEDEICYCVNNVIDTKTLTLGTFGSSAVGNKITGGNVGGTFAFGNDAHNNKIILTNEDSDCYYGNNTMNIVPISTNIFSKYWKGTRDEYDNISYHDPKTLYIIVD